jgi:hypothetical protein
VFTVIVEVIHRRFWVTDLRSSVVLKIFVTQKLPATSWIWNKKAWPQRVARPHGIIRSSLCTVAFPLTCYPLQFAANGDRYEGHWAKDLKDGAGTFYYAQKGKRYEGVWKEDIARCGSYSAYDDRTSGSLPLPELRMAEPDLVLATRRVELASASC